MFGPVSTTSWEVDPFKSDIVGDEGLPGRRGPALDDRMTRVDDGHLVAVVHLGLDVIVDGRVFRERRQDVERAQRARRRLDPGRLGGDGRAQGVEDLQLALDNALVGSQNALLVLLQRGSDEAFATGDRLFPVIVGRDRVEVRFRHLDVIAEHAVVPDLQGSDARSRSLSLFHGRDELLAGSADRLELVQTRVHAVAREPPFARQRRRFVDQGGLDAVADVAEVVELGDERLEERRAEGGQQLAHPRNDRKRLLQTHQIARPGRPERRLRHQAFEVLDRLDGAAEFAPIGGQKREFLDGVEPIAYGIEGEQRPQQPPPEQAAANRRDGPVELVEQGSFAAAFGSVEDLQMLERRPIDQQRIGALAVDHGANVREIDLLGRPQIVDERARGRDSEGMPIEPESLQPAGAQLIEERAARRLVLERPGVDRRHRQTRRRDAAPAVGRVQRHGSVGAAGSRHDNLPRLQHGELVGQSLHAVGPGIFRGREFAGREVEQRHAHGAARAASRVSAAGASATRNAGSRASR